MYRGKSTHHLVVWDADKGTFLVNGRSFGQFHTLEDLVSQLHKPTAGWPVPFTSAVVPPSDEVRTSQPQPTCRAQSSLDHIPGILLNLTPQPPRAPLFSIGPYRHRHGIVKVCLFMRMYVSLCRDT